MRLDEIINIDPSDELIEQLIHGYARGITERYRTSEADSRNFTLLPSQIYSRNEVADSIYELSLLKSALNNAGISGQSMDIIDDLIAYLKGK